jgi:hypothetical protein
MKVKAPKMDLTFVEQNSTKGCTIDFSGKHASKISLNESLKLVPKKIRIIFW